MGCGGGDSGGREWGNGESWDMLFLLADCGPSGTGIMDLSRCGGTVIPACLAYMGRRGKSFGRQVLGRVGP